METVLLCGFAWQNDREEKTGLIWCSMIQGKRARGQPPRCHDNQPGILNRGWVYGCVLCVGGGGGGGVHCNIILRHLRSRAFYI